MEELETDRLILRQFRGSDLDALAQVFAKPEVWWFPYRRGFDRDETERALDRFIARWEEQGFGLWAAVPKETGRLAGFIGLSVPQDVPEVLPAVEVGWRLDPDVWGRGLASEGARASVRYAFDTVGVDHVISLIEPENTASIRVAEKLGMSLGLRTTHPVHRLPLVVYELTRS